MIENQQTILGISFDGLAVSGIVNGFLSFADVLRADKMRVLLDLGYDITLGRTKELDRAFFPPWVEPIRCLGDGLPPRYTEELVIEARSRVIQGTTIPAAKIYDEICDELATLMVDTFKRERVRYILVENGTLPDNPLFTEAVYRAIAQYGNSEKLGKYVLWRDHDLMWSVEPHLYGPFPYPGVRKPEENEHIEFAVMTEWMRKRMLAWAPGCTYHIIPNRFLFPALTQPTSASIRAAYGIPEDAYLITRCTRVVPQKSIERDLRLIDQLQRRLSAMSNSRKIFLFVTGPVGEDPEEFDRLQALAQNLSIADQVIWADGLLPFHTLLLAPELKTRSFSIRDALAESDLNSFLTTYDYEAFGNPPGEAMAMSVPFISTTYELYHEVYGSKGAIAPLLAIDRTSQVDEPMPESFLDWTLQVLVSSDYREQITSRNLEVCQRFFSFEALAKQVEEIFPGALT